MDVEVKAALQFKTRAALEKAIVAFDDNAYPEFFNSGMWSLAGTYATCDAQFEIEPDCDYERAFRAFGKSSIDGVMELRDRRENTVARFAKRTWGKGETASFGTATSELVASWQTELTAGKAADTAAGAKAAKKSKATSIAVDVKLNLTAGAVCSDGTLAIATPKRVMFYSMTGEKLGEQLVAENGFGWIRDLFAMQDGSVAAYNHEGCRSLALVRPDGVTLLSNGDRSFGDITAGVAFADGVAVAWGGLNTYILENQKLRTLSTRSKDNAFVHGALPWRDGVLSWRHGEVAFHTRAGEQRWSVDADAVVFNADVAITAEFDKTVVRTPDGMAKHVLDTAPGHAPSFERDKPAWVLEGDRLYVAKRSIEEWNVTTGKLVTTIQPHNPNDLLCGCLRVDNMTVAWADAPIRDRKDRDSRVMFVRDGKVVDQFDAKGDVLEGIQLGAGAIAVRTKTKMFVWRAGVVQTLGGHRGIAGFMATPNGQLVSWGTDKTFRIWSV